MKKLFPILCFLFLKIYFSVSVTDPILITPSALQLELGVDCEFSIRILTASNKSALTIVKENNTNSGRTVLDITDGSYNASDIWASRAQVTVSRVFSNETTIKISLVSVRLEDEGLYVVRTSGSTGNDVKRFPIKTFVNPRDLRLQVFPAVAHVITGTVLNITCSGNVGRPLPVLQLLKANPFNPAYPYIVQTAKVGSENPDGTFQVDHVFRYQVAPSEVGLLNFTCDMYYDVVLPFSIPTVKSETSSLEVVASGQNARITAPDRFILNTERIQIDCQPAGPSYSQINALAILKNNQPMITVGILNGQSTINWQDSSVQSRATTNTPDLSVVSSSQLRVTIEATNTQCNDEAVYTCRVNGLDSGFNAVPNNEVSHNVTVEVRPDRMNDMQISPLPSTAGQYSRGENITLSCTGTVGAYTDPPRITWCIQRSGDFNPTDLETDNNFRSISQSNAQSVGSTPTTSCQFERTSTVVYQVANTDTDTTFFCQITAPGDSGICGQGTVRQQKSIEVAATNPPLNPDPQDGGATANAGAIAGGVIGGLAFIILIVLIIYFVFVRKRNPGETYRTREEKDAKDPNAAPVYSVPDKQGGSNNGVPIRESIRENSPPPKVELHYADLDVASNPPRRPQNNREATEYASKRGYENKAVDEPHTKPKERDRERERERDHRRHDGRGHANPAMYNHNDYDRDHDRDGTPEPRNANPGGPMGSAV